MPLDFYRNAKSGKIQKGDILICKDGARTGKTAIVRNELGTQAAMINEHVFLLRANNNITQYYIFQILFSEIGQNLLKRYITGAAQGGLNRSNLTQIKLPVPPLEIQRKIVLECEQVEEEYERTRMRIETYRKKIEEIFIKLEVISKQVNEQART